MPYSPTLQCGDLDPWAVNEHFGQLRAECIVAKKPMLTVELTYIALSISDQKRKFRSEGACVRCRRRAPNISPTHSTPQAGFDYACKDGDAVAGGLGRPDAGKIAGERSKWHDIMDAESRREFYQLCMELDPRSLCISFGNIEKFLDWRYRGIQSHINTRRESSVWRMIFLSLHSGTKHT